MAIFEKRNTPQQAVQNEINEKLSSINQKYTEIGRIVKIRLADKIDDAEIQGLISNIDTTLEELKTLNEKLNTLNGIKVCTNCGHNIPINVAFCPDCGAKQPVVQSAAPAAQQVNAPVQQPNVQPVQIPQPVINTQPEPIPQPTVIPQPEPVPQPTVIPQPDPVPQPTVIPQPEPVPQPEVIPQPEPAPQPVQSETAVSENIEEKPVDPVIKEEAKFIFCSQCGNKESADMKFCSQCGNPL